MKVEFVNFNDINTEMNVAGWMASASYDTKNVEYAKIAKHCINSGHGTPTRPMRFIFEISEVSRAFSHEFVRHEIGVAKVQRSQRYVNEDGFGYVTPKALEGKRVDIEICSQGEDNYLSLTFDELQDLIKQWYVGAMDQGVKAEDARYALTNATHTKIHVAFDWEGLMQFCFRRCCTRAQWEIRELAFLIIEEIHKVYPFLADKLGAPCHVHGYCPEVKGCGKAPSKDELMVAYKKIKLYESIGTAVKECE